jgi:protein gp37
LSLHGWYKKIKALRQVPKGSNSISDDTLHQTNMVPFGVQGTTSKATADHWVDTFHEFLLQNNSAFFFNQNLFISFSVNCPLCPLKGLLAGK